MQERNKAYLPKQQREDHHALPQKFQGRLQKQYLHHIPLQALL